VKAIILREFGPADETTLRLEEVAEPRVESTDVLIKVAVCGVCYHDVLVRGGVIRHGVEMPLLTGHEVSGHVVDVGADVKAIKVGDRVCVLPQDYCGRCKPCRTGRDNLCVRQQSWGHRGLTGGYAEYMKVPECSVVHVPENVDLDGASGFGCAAGTAMRGLRGEGHLQPGETAVVTGAGGGLGMFSVQIAKAMGARVIAVTTSAWKAEAIARAGADHVVVAPDGRFHEQVKQLTDGVGADLICDQVGAVQWHSTIRSVANGGRIIFQGQVTADTLNFSPALIVLRSVAMKGAKSASYQDLVDVVELARQGKIQSPVSVKLPLREAGRAHQLVMDRKVAGRVALVP
jgi:acryloyl-coenzyme A reductase